MAALEIFEPGGGGELPYITYTGMFYSTHLNFYHQFSFQSNTV